MSHENNNSPELKTETVTTEEQETVTVSMADLAKLVNSSVAKQLAQAGKKTKPVAKTIDAVPELETVIDDQPTDDPQLKLMRSLQKQVNDLKTTANKEREKAQSLYVRSEISTLLQDKVVGDWMPEAVSAISSKVSWENETAIYSADETNHYTLSDGVSEWLKNPINKKFLPAPKKLVGKTVQPSFVQTSQFSQQKAPPGTEQFLKESAENLTNELAAQGGSIHDLF